VKEVRRLAQEQLQQRRWRRLRRSADNLPGTVPVRDFKNTEGPALVFPTRAWALFINSP
jgi:hypothetical protein